MTKLGRALLPHAGEYAYHEKDFSDPYKLHDIIAYWLFRIIPTAWTMGGKINKRRELDT